MGDSPCHRGTVPVIGGQSPMEKIAMMRRTIVTVLCTCLWPTLSFAQHEGHGAMPADQIGSGSVKFDTSCAAPVKDDFNQAVALLHSFWFPEATKMFEDIAKKDP